MRRLFTLIFCLASLMARAQCHGQFNFEDIEACYKPFIIIDTVNYHNNRWQVGSPHKANLNSPHSAPNVIITDTLNTYPTNDTSAFILKVPDWMPYSVGSFNGYLQTIQFYYRVDVDSHIHAIVELSTDSGLHWMNVRDSLPYSYHWSTQKPRFDTSTADWLLFTLDVDHTGPLGDTMLMRFTLISDSATSGRDGWMIDDIGLWYMWESVPLLKNPNLISLYPNPSHGKIYIHTDKPNKDATITITNIQGQQVYDGPTLVNGYLNLQLPNGIYTLKYCDDEEYCVKQIVIQN